MSLGKQAESLAVKVSVLRNQPCEVVNGSTSVYTMKLRKFGFVCRCQKPSVIVTQQTDQLGYYDWKNN